MHDEFLNQRLDGTIDIIEMLSAIMILFLVSQRSYVNAKYKILSILLDEFYKMLDCDTIVTLQQNECHSASYKTSVIYYFFVRHCQNLRIFSYVNGF
jgi:hypothetical protein